MFLSNEYCLAYLVYIFCIRCVLVCVVKLLFRGCKPHTYFHSHFLVHKLSFYCIRLLPLVLVLHISLNKVILFMLNIENLPSSCYMYKQSDIWLSRYSYNHDCWSYNLIHKSSYVNQKQTSFLRNKMRQIYLVNERGLWVHKFHQC